MENTKPILLAMGFLLAIGIGVIVAALHNLLEAVEEIIRLLQ